MLLDFTNPRLPQGVRADKVFGSMNTPNSVASNMVNMTWEEIKDRVDKDWVFLNVCCKTGVFPTNLFDKLVTCKNLVKAFPNYYERRHWILENMIKCISTNQTAKEFSGLYLYGLDYIVYEHNIKVIPENEVCAYLRKLKGENMRFDIVIGNPPYNNDIYLDFVTAGHELASKFSCWITPAKWQAKGGERNEKFRENIVPYMKEIVFYPEAKEVFDVGEWDGITYFNIDKNKTHNTKSIQNICKSNNVLDSFMEQTDEVSVTLYRKSIRDILRKIDYSKNMSNKCRVIYSEFVGNTYWGNKDKRAENDLELYQGEKHIGYVPKSKLRTDVNTDKYKVITSVMAGAGIYSMDKNGKALGSNKLNKLGPNQVPKGSYTCLAFFDSSEECDSYMSYFETKLISFLVYIGVCGTSFAEEFWRFIPQPEAFDHIFTDQELYAKYDLTYEEINIIESVIKERK